jgi:DnaJ family protein A protein 2
MASSSGENVHSSNLYERLGVSRDAGVDEIRRAYKDLARVKHPDRGGDAEEFKKIQEAHEILSDDDRRRMYDMTGSTGSGGGGMATGGMAAGGFPFHFVNGAGPFGMSGVAFDMGDVFQHIFGGGGGGPSRRRKEPRGPNKYHDIGLTLKDFYAGKEIKLKFNQVRRCTTCSGSGAEATEPCGGCNGTGVKVVSRPIGPGLVARGEVQCDACNGEGVRVMRACRGCHGKRFMEREKQLDISIKPGMRDGEQLTFAGECSDSMEFEAPGDVVLTLRRSDTGVGGEDGEDEFEWSMDDLLIKKRITYAESILGFQRVFENHPGGAKRICWRGGPLLHGATLRLEGAGMPKKGGGHGSLHVQVVVTPPAERPWSAEEAAKLQSVLGGPAATMDGDAGAAPLKLGVAEYKVSHTM